MRSYLVVGNQTLDSPELEAAIAERMAAGPAEFHVVVPATPIQRGLTWDEDEARATAEQRLADALERFRAAGAAVTGEVGHRDPVEATEDALRGREVDEVLLSTLPPGISRWLGQDVPTRLKGSVLVPVTVVTTQRQSVPASGS
jgi:GABA permease